MLVKIEARLLIFPGTDFHFPSTSVPPSTFLGSVLFSRASCEGPSGGSRAAAAVADGCREVV